MLGEQQTTPANKKNPATARPGRALGPPPFAKLSRQPGNRTLLSSTNRSEESDATLHSGKAVSTTRAPTASSRSTHPSTRRRSVGRIRRGAGHCRCRLISAAVGADGRRSSAAHRPALGDTGQFTAEHRGAQPVRASVPDAAKTSSGPPQTAPAVSRSVDRPRTRLLAPSRITAANRATESEKVRRLKTCGEQGLFRCRCFPACAGGQVANLSSAQALPCSGARSPSRSGSIP